jgi:hypothetical protein
LAPPLAIFFDDREELPADLERPDRGADYRRNPSAANGHQPVTPHVENLIVYTGKRFEMSTLVSVTEAVPV